METKYLWHEDSNNTALYVSPNDAARSLNVCCHVNATFRPSCIFVPVNDMNPISFSIETEECTAANSMHSAWRVFPILTKLRIFKCAEY